MLSLANVVIKNPDLLSNGKQIYSHSSCVITTPPLTEGLKELSKKPPTLWQRLTGRIKDA